MVTKAQPRPAKKFVPKKTEKISEKINGGARPGAGRKKGSPNKKTAAVQKAVAESGITPLEFMLNVMRQEISPEGANGAEQIAFHSLRFEAAKAAAPYVHAKLSSVEVNATIAQHEAGLDELA